MRRFIFPAAVGLVAGGFYLASSNPQFRFMEGASAIKLLHAQALLSGGGYREIGRVGTPPEILRPPGFPLFLAGVISIFGWNFLAMKLVNNALAPAGALVLFYLLRRRTGSSTLAAALAAAGYLFPAFFYVARYLEAEILFCLLFFGALLAFERAQDEGFRERRFLAVFCVFMAASCLVRTAGLVLLPSALVVLGVCREGTRRERVRWAAVITAAWLVSGGVWSLRNQLVAPPGEFTYWDKIFGGEPVESVYWLALDHLAPLLPPPPVATAADFALRFFSNLRFFLFETLCMVWPPSSSWPGALKAGVMVLPGLFFLLGLGHGLAVRRRLLDFTLVFYGAMLLFYPHQDRRFLIPAAPFLLLHLVEGLRWFSSRQWLGSGGRRWQRIAEGVMLGFLLVSFLVQAARRLAEPPPPMPEIVRSRYFRITSPHAGCYHTAYLFELIRKHSAPTDRVMYHSYPPCAFLTGRQCSSIPLVEPGRLVQYLDEAGITLVVVDDEALYGPAITAAFTRQFLLPAVRAYPDRFETLFTFPGSSARVLRVVPAGEGR